MTNVAITTAGKSVQHGIILATRLMVTAILVSGAVALPTASGAIVSDAGGERNVDDDRDFAALPDVVMLRNGGRLEGSVQRQMIDGSEHYVVTLKDGGQVVLSSRMVRMVRSPGPEMAEYIRRRQAMEDTVEQHWQLYHWCQENAPHQLSAQMDYHLRRIIQLNPDDRQARMALGHQFDGGRWIDPDHRFVAHGFVRQGRSWIPVEFLQVQEARAEVGDARSETNRALRRWYDRLNRPVSPQARQELLRLVDATSVDWLVQRLFPPRNMQPERDPAVRHLFLEALTQINTPQAIQRVTEVAILDDSRETRQRAIALLKQPQIDRTIAVRIALSFLGNSDNQMVQRAAIVLGEMRHPMAVRPLIDALVTQHRVANPGAGGPPVSFNPAQGSLQTGGSGPATVQVSINNESVLSALRALTGQDLGFNKQRWLDWYSRTYTVTEADLRRDR